MQSWIRRIPLLLLCLTLVTASAADRAQSASLKLIKSVDLPGYSGDFDHFAADYDRNRLLLAAEDHGTLEVFDLKTSEHLRTVSGFGNPHSILVRKGVPTIFITDSAKQNATIRDAATYARKKTVDLTPGSDTSKYDPASNTLYVVTGGKDVDMKPRIWRQSTRTPGRSSAPSPSRITTSKRWRSWKAIRGCSST